MEGNPTMMSSVSRLLSVVTLLTLIVDTAVGLSDGAKIPNAEKVRLVGVDFCTSRQKFL